MSKWNLLLFGIYPYVALAICLIGSWARFDLSQYSWKAGSSQMLNQRGMRVASNLFHDVVQNELQLPGQTMQQLKLTVDERGGGLGAEAPTVRFAPSAGK